MRSTRIGIPRAAALGVGLLAAIFVVFPATAGAAGSTLHAAPSGDGEACTEVLPCTIEQAIKEAGDGDSVKLDGGGEYTLALAGLTISHEIDIGGAPGRPARLAANSPSANLRVSVGAGATLHDIRVEGSNLELESGTAERVYVAYPGLKEPKEPMPSAACELGDGVVLSDSVCWADETGEVSEANGVGMTTYDEGAHRSASLWNVTAVATNFAGHGIMGLGGATETTIDGTNVIARAENATDIYVATTFSFPRLHLNLDHSNFATVREEEPRAVVTPAGVEGNQTAPPLFADAAEGDFHELSGSPTIDAGGATEAGALDLEGAERVLPGCAGAPPVSDIGAYELESTVPCPVAPPPVEVPTPEPSKAAFRIVRVTLHGARGTAQVETPGAGMLTLTGSGVKLATQTTKGPEIVQMPIKPWAITLVRLNQAGSTRVKLKVRFAALGAPPKEERRGLLLRAARRHRGR